MVRKATRCGRAMVMVVFFVHVVGTALLPWLLVRDMPIWPVGCRRLRLPGCCCIKFVPRLSDVLPRCPAISFPACKDAWSPSSPMFSLVRGAEDGVLIPCLIGVFWCCVWCSVLGRCAIVSFVCVFTVSWCWAWFFLFGRFNVYAANCRCVRLVRCRI